MTEREELFVGQLKKEEFKRYIKIYLGKMFKVSIISFSQQPIQIIKNFLCVVHSTEIARFFLNGSVQGVFLQCLDCQL